MFSDCLLLAIVWLHYSCFFLNIFKLRLILDMKWGCINCPCKMDQDVEPKCKILLQHAAQLGAGLSCKFWGFIPIYEIRGLWNHPTLNTGRQRNDECNQFTNMLLFPPSICTYLYTFCSFASFSRSILFLMCSRDMLIYNWSMLAQWEHGRRAKK